VFFKPRTKRCTAPWPTRWGPRRSTMALQAHRPGRHLECAKSLHEPLKAGGVPRRSLTPSGAKRHLGRSPAPPPKGVYVFRDAQGSESLDRHQPRPPPTCAPGCPRPVLSGQRDSVPAWEMIGLAERSLIDRVPRHGSRRRCREMPPDRRLQAAATTVGRSFRNGRCGSVTDEVVPRLLIVNERREDSCQPTWHACARGRPRKESISDASTTRSR